MQSYIKSNKLGSLLMTQFLEVLLAKVNQGQCLRKRRKIIILT